MTQSSHLNFTHSLQQLMQRVGISSFKALSRQAGVSERQLKRLRQGQLAQMQLETLQKLSVALAVPLSELLKTFGGVEFIQEPDTQTAAAANLESLQREYQRLQTQLMQQRQTLMQEFQQSSLQVLESFLIYWPTASQRAQENPQMEAVKLLPLVKPVQQLISQWGVEAIGAVGEELSYDPRLHQLLKGTAEAGETVKVSNVGYRQGDKLLHRAKVIPLSNP